METFLSCLVLWDSAVSSPAQASSTPSACDPPLVAKLKPLFLAKMQHLCIPVVMIYVDDPVQGAWTTAMVIGNLASREPMQVNNSMCIGSITKTLTSTLSQREVTHPVIYW